MEEIIADYKKRIKSGRWWKPDDDHPNNEPIDIKNELCSSTASFIVINQNVDGSYESRMLFDGPCHWDLKREGYDGEFEDGSKPVAVVDSVIRIRGLNKELRDVAKKYVCYFAYESPWSVCYDDSIRRNQRAGKRFSYFWHMNLQVSGDMLASACIGMRQVTEEYYNILPMFKWCLEQGFSNTVSYILSYYMGRNEQGRFFHQDNGCSHCHIGSYASKDDVLNLFANGIDTEGQELSYQDCQMYYDVYGVVGHYRYNETDKMRGWIRDHTPEKYTGDGFNRKSEIAEADVHKLAALIEQEIKERKE